MLMHYRTNNTQIQTSGLRNAFQTAILQAVALKSWLEETAMYSSPDRSNDSQGILTRQM